MNYREIQKRSRELSEKLIGTELQYMGDRWEVRGVGNTNQAGETYLHLASKTRKRLQKNGWYPVQTADWIDIGVNPETLQISEVA